MYFWEIQFIEIFILSIKFVGLDFPFWVKFLNKIEASLLNAKMIYIQSIRNSNKSETACPWSQSLQVQSGSLSLAGSCIAIWAQVF